MYCTKRYSSRAIFLMGYYHAKACSKVVKGRCSVQSTSNKTYGRVIEEKHFLVASAKIEEGNLITSLKQSKPPGQGMAFRRCLSNSRKIHKLIILKQLVEF